MNISQQRLHKLEIKNLKNIKDLHISFEDKNITAILGPNGSGKSTILHALAGCFRSLEKDQQNYKFCDFFLPHPDGEWTGNELTITHTYRKESERYSNVETEFVHLGESHPIKITKESTKELKEYLYSKPSIQWFPPFPYRPIRDVEYIGIDSCVPLIEIEKQSIVEEFTESIDYYYETKKIDDNIAKIIREKASYCLNKNYTTYNIHESSNGKRFIGVEFNGGRYSALTMSAGEQKVFLLLERVFRAKRYSLILIDEIDLLLHDSAMKKLIKVIADRAEDKKLQVVFTTHRESVLELSHLINVRHIFNTEEKTLCFNETKPDAINRLTGAQLRPIEVFVEDDLAVVIVKKIVAQLGISRYISVQRFGAAINCFTVLAGLVLRGEDCDNSLFVLDGDVYKTKDEQEKHIKKLLTGDDETAKSLRQISLEKIKSLKLPENTNPEKYIHSIIASLDTTDSNEHNEIVAVAKEIIVVDDSHKYIDDIINRLDFDRSSGLSKIIDLLSCTPEWEIYVADVKNWLNSKVALLQETISLES